MPSLERNAGRAYWRSLDELAESPEFRAHLEREFPYLDAWSAPSRRQFLKVMGASLALGGLTACRWPKEPIVPYTRRPEGRIPGVPVQYATCAELVGVGRSLVATSYDGRPIKLDGNDLEHFSRGASDAITQAAVLEMYDPDRSRWPEQQIDSRREKRSWAQFEAFARRHFAALRSRQGQGLAILSRASSSKTLNDVKAEFLKAYPQARWYEYEPVSRDNERIGTKLAFGTPMRPIWHFDKADVVVSFDCDFLGSHPAAVRSMRDFAARRSADDKTMNRLYVLESTYSLTGTNADERYAVRSGELALRLCQLAAELVRGGLVIEGLPGVVLRQIEGFHAGQLQPGYLRQIAADLLAHRGRSLICVGPRVSPEAHAIAAVLNAALGNAGQTLEYVPEPDPDRPTHVEAIRELAARLKAGEIDTLVILDVNAAYNAPADLFFGAEIAKARTSIHLGLYVDETAKLCTWHVPRAHELESWGDARSWDGTLCIQQPLIDPLYGGRSAAELLAMLTGQPVVKGYELVRRSLRPLIGEQGFEEKWRRCLHDGLVPATAWKRSAPAPKLDGLVAWLEAVRKGYNPKAEGFELVFVPDSKVYDGRFANNGWLQELPDPVTKITWDNAAWISPADAEKLGGLGYGDEVEITLAGRKLRMPVYVLPGHAEGSITLPLGYGRSAGGVVQEGAGFNTYLLRTSEGLDVAGGAQVRATGRRLDLATTQDHHAITSRVGEEEKKHRVPELLREGTLAEYVKNPRFATEGGHELPVVQLFDLPKLDGPYRWAMAIDLSRCTGCSACVVACQAENNIPVVGKQEVLRGREMHWLRVDRYFSGEPTQPETVRVGYQPVPCQQCENAPCEQVCPVGATMHDQEGLNVMVYNRCIGTRYCLNNCPWKVRRFNWFYNHHGPYHPRSRKFGKPRYPATPPEADLTPVEMMVFNPEVTVRSRGVMEKCTFCLQRIANAKIVARNEDRRIRDGEVVTACQQTCPAEAIVFGDLNDPESRIRRYFQHERAYEMLGEVNARTRMRYLAKLRNPAGAGGAGESGHEPAHAEHEV